MRSDVFDPSAPSGKQWHRLHDMPYGFTHAQGLVVGNQIWFVGGYQGNHPGPGETKVWRYDTTTDTWANGPDLPELRGAGAAAVIGRTIYFTGGMDATRTIDEGTTWSPNLENLAAGWVRKADLPNPRNHVAGAALNGYFYVIGGQHGQEREPSLPVRGGPLQPGQRHVDQGRLAAQPALAHHVEHPRLPGPHRHRSAARAPAATPQSTIYDYDPRTNALVAPGQPSGPTQHFRLRHRREHAPRLDRQLAGPDDDDVDGDDDVSWTTTRASAEHDLCARRMVTRPVVEPPSS